MKSREIFPVSIFGQLFLNEIGFSGIIPSIILYIFLKWRDILEKKLYFRLLRPSTMNFVLKSVPKVIQPT